MLKTLHRLNYYFKEIDDVSVENPLQKLNRNMRSNLINEDPSSVAFTLENWKTHRVDGTEQM